MWRYDRVVLGKGLQILLRRFDSCYLLTPMFHSSMVERYTVNVDVAGSSPAGTAMESYSNGKEGGLLNR